MADVKVVIVGERDILAAAALLGTQISLPPDKLVAAVQGFVNSEDHVLLMANLDGVQAGLLACSIDTKASLLSENGPSGFILALIVQRLFKGKPIVAQLLRTAGFWFKRHGVTEIIAELPEQMEFEIEELKKNGFNLSRQLLSMELT